MSDSDFDYTHRAARANKTDIVFSVVCYISAAFLYLYPIFVKGVRFVPILQFLALVCLVAGIYINQRYTWVYYVYGVIPSENKNSGEVTGVSLVVYRVQGKRKTTLAKADLCGIKALIPCTHKDPHNAEVTGYGAASRYDFRATMCPAEYCRIVLEADGGLAVISFEPDKTLYSLLSKYLDEKGAER